MSNPDTTLKYVHRDSQEFKQFVIKLEHNYDASNKLSMCILCWGFLTSYQKKKHMSHSPYIVTASFCKNEDQFMKHATQQNKTKDHNKLVALFNEQCQQLIENPYMTPVPQSRPHMPTSSSANVPMNQINFQDLKQVMQKQFQQEQHIHRLLISIDALKDQIKLQQITIQMLADRMDTPKVEDNNVIVHNNENSMIPEDSAVIPIKSQPPTVTLNETPLQCLDRSDILSMAYATNRSAPSHEDLLSSVNHKILDESRALINLDRTYGVKMQGQYIEEEFKYTGGFTNIKNKKQLAKKKHSIDIPELAGIDNPSQATLSGTPTKQLIT